MCVCVSTSVLYIHCISLLESTQETGRQQLGPERDRESQTRTGMLFTSPANPLRMYHNLIQIVSTASLLLKESRLPRRYTRVWYRCDEVCSVCLHCTR